MREPPYDRAFALAAQVLAMRHHYLEVRCGCGARRVIALGRMTEDPKMKRLTLASVAARLRCAGCFTGPDEVHLTATIYGLDVWSRDEVTRVEFEDFWCCRPGVADGFERGLPPERLEMLGKVIGRHEGEDVGFEAFQIGIMERLNGRLFDGSVWVRASRGCQ